MASKSRRTIEFLLTAKDKTKGALNSAQAGLTKFRKSIAGIASQLGLAFGGAGVLAGIKRTADEMDRLGKTADKLGATTEELSELRYAAELTGVAANTLDQGLQRMVRRVAEAAQGTGEAKTALQELGLQAQELARLSVGDQFTAIAEAMGDIENQSDRVRLAFKLFDSGGVALLNTLALGEDGIKKYADELAKLGGVIDDKGAKSAAKFNDELTKLAVVIDGIWKSIAQKLIPTWNEWIGLLKKPLDLVINAPLVTEQLQEVSYAIVSIRNEIERLEDNRGIHEFLLGNTKGLDDQLDALRKSLARHEQEKQRIIEQSGVDNAQRNAERKEREHNRQMAAIRKEEEDSLKKSLNAKENALETHQDALEDYGRERLQIEQRINEAIADITGEMAPDTTKLEVLDSLSAAYDAFLGQDYTGSLGQIEKGIELLSKYKETGKASEYTIKQLADRFRELATDALSAQDDSLKRNVKNAADAYEAFKREIEKKPIVAEIWAADGSGKAIVDGVQVQINKERRPVVEVVLGIAAGANMPPVATQADYDAIHGGSDIERESAKRGFRL